MDFALITTTVPEQRNADELALGVLESRLAACVQQHAVMTDAWWQGSIQHVKEIVVQFKTRGALIEPLKQYILNNHPYKVPEIIVQEISGGTPTYLRWITDETTGGRL